MNVHDDALQTAVAQAAVDEYPAQAVETELAETASDLGDSSDELSEISRQVDVSGTIAESMESFMTGFMDRVPEGEWDARTSRQYRMGMSSILAAHGYSVNPNDVSASFEAAGVTQTNDENRKESGDKSKDIIQKLLEILKKALSDMLEAIKRFGTRIMNNSVVVRKAGVQLQNSVNALKYDIPAGEFDGKPAWGIYYQAREGASVSSAANVVHNAGLEINHLLGNWDKSFKTQLELLSHPDHTDSIRTAGGTVKTSISGGIVLESEFVDSGFNGHGNNLAKVTIKVTKADYPTGKIPYLTKAEVLEVAKAMIANADQMKSISAQNKPIEAEINKLLKDLNQRLNNNKGATTDSLQRGRAQASIARSVIAKYPLAMQTLVPQIAVVAMNAWRHAQASIMKAHKADVAKGKGAKRDDKDGIPLGA